MKFKPDAFIILFLLSFVSCGPNTPPSPAPSKPHPSFDLSAYLSQIKQVNQLEQDLKQSGIIFERKAEEKNKEDRSQNLEIKIVNPLDLTLQPDQLKSTRLGSLRVYIESLETYFSRYAYQNDVSENNIIQSSDETIPNPLKLKLAQELLGQLQNSKL